AVEDHLCTGVSHLFDGAIHVAGTNIDAGDRVEKDSDLESRLARIECRLLHAVIGRDAADVYVLDSAVSQFVDERSPFKCLPIERGVRVSRGILSLADYDRIRRQLQAWMKLCAFGLLHAVRWPCAAIRAEVGGHLRMPIAGHVDRQSPDMGCCD